MLISVRSKIVQLLEAFRSAPLTLDSLRKRAPETPDLALIRADILKNIERRGQAVAKPSTSDVSMELEGIRTQLKRSVEERCWRAMIHGAEAQDLKS